MKELQKYTRLTIAGFVLLTWNSLTFAQASPDDIWSTVADDTVNALAAESDATVNVQPNVDPTEYHMIRLNSDALQEALSRAPLEMREVDSEFRPEPVIIYLPTPTGDFAAFEIYESVIMEPELASKFPDIKTYSGISRDDSLISVRFDSTPAGFHAQILSPGERWFIDPQFKDNSDIYLSYFSRSLPAGTQQCLLEGDAGRGEFSQSSARSGDLLRTYRLAVAATGEYTAFHGGTVGGGMGAIVTTINRVVGIYEKEVAVRLTLVGNNNLLVYTDSASDPFTGNANANVLIDESQAVITSVIGTPNFDIGHTFSSGAGGRAGLGVVCNAASKASGVTGRSNPIGDPYDVDYVAHEIGHQFGGSHTFNGAISSCSGANRSGNNAYEPGSGSTIQAYAGICGSDNLQLNTDPVFHSESHRQIMEHVTLGSGGTCGTTTVLGNAIPVADAGPDFSIPAGTAFALTGSATDADAGDMLTHLWEERDLGPQSQLATADQGSIPLFRVYTPSSSPVRYLPRLSTLATGIPDVQEKIPAVARTSNWRYTVRDQQGGVESDDMLLAIIDTAPFLVSSPNGGESVSGTTIVTWDVAGTSVAPVSATNVDILLSVDDGLTYPTTLLAATPNDGSQSVVMPNSATTTARIMVKGNNHVFLDVSNANFTITTGSTVAPGPVTNLIGPAGTITDKTPTYSWDSVTGATQYNLYVNDTTGNVISTWYAATALGCNNGGVCSIEPATPLYIGGGTWWVQSRNTAGDGPWSAAKSFDVAAAGPPIQVTDLISPSGNIENNTPTYSWGSVPESSWYRLYVNDANGLAFSTWHSVQSLGCLATGVCSITPSTVLAPGNGTWWVQSWNKTATGPWSAAKSYTVPGGGIPVAVTNFISPTSPAPSTPTYSWSAVTGSTYYELYVNDVSGNTVTNTWYTAASLGCSAGVTCSITTAQALPPGSSTVWVRTWNTFGYGPWSAPHIFDVM